MSNEMVAQGNATPVVIPNAHLSGRKLLIDREQWEAFTAVCGEAYKLINDYRKLVTANAKMRATQVDMLNREMKMLETEFKNEKTTAKRRAEIIERVGQINDKMGEAMKNVKEESVGWWVFGGFVFICLLIKALRALR